MDTVIIHGDGIHDDTEALQAIINGKAKGIRPDGRASLDGAVCKITQPIRLTVDEPVSAGDALCICKKCQYTWTPRKEAPKACPECKSRSWNKD